MTLRRRGSAKEKYLARKTWLSADPTTYLGVPGINDDVTDAGHIALDILQRRLADAGLLGNARDQRDTIRRLVSELRGEHVGVGW